MRQTVFDWECECHYRIVCRNGDIYEFFEGDNLVGSYYVNAQTLVVSIQGHYHSFWSNIDKAIDVDRSSHNIFFNKDNEIITTLWPSGNNSLEIKCFEPLTIEQARIRLHEVRKVLY